MIDVTEKISTIEEVVRIGTSHPDLWFRGQPKKYETLLPTVFRKKYVTKFGKLNCNNQEDIVDPEEERLLKVEQHFVAQFKNKALSVTPELPDDNMDLLLLMRHFGTPTRLLDWTENVLVALFFAVNSLPKADAELWVLNPISLSDYNVVDILPQFENEYLKALCSEPFVGDMRSNLAIDLVPHPFVPQHKIPRMVTQSSMFTVHPRYFPDLAEVHVSRRNVYLKCYVVEAAQKKTLRKQLSMLGINNLTLFPNLEGLSRHLTSEVDDE